MATWPNTIDDDGSGESGLALDDAFFDQIKAYVDAQRTDLGTAGAVDIPFNAVNFIGQNGATWSVAAGHVLINRYVITNKVLTWWLTVQGAAITGAGGNLLVGNLPFGFLSPLQYIRPTYFYMGGPQADMWIHPNASPNNAIVIEPTYTGPALVAGVMHLFATLQFQVT